MNLHDCMIDLGFTEEAAQISELEYQPPLDKSDHCVLTFDFHCYIDYAKPRSRFAYEKANYDEIKKQLQEDSNWSHEIIENSEKHSIEECGRYLKRKFLSYVTSMYQFQRLHHENRREVYQ